MTITGKLDIISGQKLKKHPAELNPYPANVEYRVSSK